MVQPTLKHTSCTDKNVFSENHRHMFECIDAFSKQKVNFKLIITGNYMLEKPVAIELAPH